MKTESTVRWGERTAQGLGIFFVASALLAIWPGWPCLLDLLSDDKASGWAQAIGSIAAIVGTFVVANHQHSLQQKAEGERVQGELSHRRAILEAAIENLRRTSEYLAEKARLGHLTGRGPYAREFFAQAYSPLVAFPSLEIRDPNLALEVMWLVQVAKMAEAAFDADEPNKLSETFSGVAKNCSQALDKYWPKAP